MDRFEFLDSFRGLLALSVIFKHSGWGYYIIDGYFFGVLGFFLLSAFLLTYRLTQLYESSQNNPREIIKITVNYLITRFFRIYVPFVIFCFITKPLEYFAYGYSKHDSLINLITLKYTPDDFDSHLWTMPFEIRYYFLIPIISLVFSKIKKANTVYALNVITVTYLALTKTLKLHVIGASTHSSFESFLPVFFLGSVLGLTYLRLEKDFKIKEKINQSSQQSQVFKYICILNYVMMFVGARSTGWLFIWKYFEDTYYFALFWALHLLLMLIGSPNHFTNMLSECNILRIFGQYSFGIYLFHFVTIFICNDKLFRFNLGDYFIKFLPSDFILAIITMSFAFGYLFYHLVEKHLMQVARVLIKKVNKMKFFEHEEDSKTAIV